MLSCKRQPEKLFPIQIHVSQLEQIEFSTVTFEFPTKNVLYLEFADKTRKIQKLYFFQRYHILYFSTMQPTVV